MLCRGLSASSSCSVCSEKYLPFHLQLVLAGTLHISDSTQHHQQLVDGSNPSQRVQGLYTKSVLHGHDSRSNTLPPIRPRPSTSVILHLAGWWLCLSNCTMPYLWQFFLKGKNRGCNYVNNTVQFNLTLTTVLHNDKLCRRCAKLPELIQDVNNANI